MIQLVLIYADGRPNFNVGGFSSEADALAWIARETAKSYWDPRTTYQIIDNSPRSQ